MQFDEHSPNIGRKTNYHSNECEGLILQQQFDTVFRMKSFYAAFQFLTILPLPGEPSPKALGRSYFWFPVVGVFIGGISGGVVFLMGFLGLPSLVTGMIGVLVLSGINGFLHLDGLADTADGFLSSRPKEKILEIMRDSRIGVMGTTTLIFTIGIKCAAVATLPAEEAWLGLIFAASAARSAQVFTITLLPSARPKRSLTSIFFLGKNKFYLVTLALFLPAMGWFLCGIHGIAAFGGVAVIGVLYSLNSMRLIGGMTGDTTGGISEITECFILVVASSEYSL